jgi:hypothetical protein
MADAIRKWILTSALQSLESCANALESETLEAQGESSLKSAWLDQGNLHLPWLLKVKRAQIIQVNFAA